MNEAGTKYLQRQTYTLIALAAIFFYPIAGSATEEQRNE
jgi:hypothetical protein